MASDREGGNLIKRIGLAMIVMALATLGALPAVASGQETCPARGEWSKTDSSTGSESGEWGSVSWTPEALTVSAADGYKVTVCVKASTELTFVDVWPNKTVTVPFTEHDISHVSYKVETCNDHETTTTTVEEETTTTTVVEETTTTTVAEETTTTTVVEETTTTTVAEETTTTTVEDPGTTFPPPTYVETTSTTVPPVTGSTLPFTGPEDVAGLLMAGTALLVLGGGTLVASKRI